MKKIIRILFLAVTASVIGQQKTLVTINGEKIQYTPPQNEWSTLGNTGITTANFIGTTDSQDVVFKRNGIKAGYIGGTTSFQTSFGVGALQSNGVGGTFGGGNSAFGANALNATTTGGGNTAVGSSALLKNTSGAGNVAVGYLALEQNTSGSYNTAVGQLALKDVTTGSKNTAIGSKTGYGITEGNANTIIGANVTGLPATLSNNIIIADGSGKQRIRVDANGNVGIGVGDLGSSPTPDALTARLEIKNTAGSPLRIDDGLPGSKAGKVLTSDINGVGTWRDAIAPVLQVVEGIAPSERVNFSPGATGRNYLKSNITLTPGNWLINVGLLINSPTSQDGGGDVTPFTTYGVRFTLSSSENTLDKTGFTFIGNFEEILYTVSIGANPPRFVFFADGMMSVNVTKTTTLYLWNDRSSMLGATLGSVKKNGENYFYATRTN